MLFETTGWVSNPRFSARGGRIAFLNHPLFYDDSGELVVVDLQGRAKTLTPLWSRTLGVAWAPDDSEILFGCGTVLRNQLLAVSPSGVAREIYLGPGEFRLEDVGRDGTSSDERWAATLDGDNRMALVALEDGTVTRLPEAGADAVPRGWSSEGHVWVTRGGEQTPARAQLLRFDVARRRIVEERSIAPTESSGAIYIRDLVVSPDGRLVAFTYGRSLGYLYLLRGVLRPAREAE